MKGFKPKEVDEQGKIIENNAEDPELNEEDPNFDKSIHELDMFKYIFADVNACFINGNFFDVDENKVSTPLVDLFTKSKKLPELVLFLKVNEETFMKRKYNEKLVEEEHKLKI